MEHISPQAPWPNSGTTGITDNNVEVAQSPAPPGASSRLGSSGQASSYLGRRDRSLSSSSYLSLRAKVRTIFAIRLIAKRRPGRLVGRVRSVEESSESQEDLRSGFL